MTNNSVKITNFEENLENNLPEFSVEFANTQKDAAEWLKIAIKNNVSNIRNKYLVVNFITTILVTFLIFYTAKTWTLQNLFEFLATFIILFLGSYFLEIWSTIYFSSRNMSKVAGFLQKRKITFTKDEFKIEAKNATSARKYISIIKFYENENYFFLMPDKIGAFIFPKKYFTKEQIEFVKSKINPENLEQNQQF